MSTEDRSHWLSHHVYTYFGRKQKINDELAESGERTKAKVLQNLEEADKTGKARNPLFAAAMQAARRQLGTEWDLHFNEKVTDGRLYGYSDIIGVNKVTKEKVVLKLAMHGDDEKHMSVPTKALLGAQGLLYGYGTGKTVAVGYMNPFKTDTPISFATPLKQKRVQEVLLSERQQAKEAVADELRTQDIPVQSSGRRGSNSGDYKVFLDIETAGRRHGASVLGYSAILARWNKDTNKYEEQSRRERFYYPKQKEKNTPDYAEAIAVNHLEDVNIDRLRKSQKATYDATFTQDELKALERYIGAVPVVGHNVNFDWQMLHGRNPEQEVATDIEPKGGLIDTFHIATAQRGSGKGRNTLDRLYKDTFGKTMEADGLPHHDPLSDVIATMRLMSAWRNTNTKMGRTVRKLGASYGLSTKFPEPMQGMYDELVDKKGDYVQMDVEDMMGIEPPRKIPDLGKSYNDHTPIPSTEYVKIADWVHNNMGEDAYKKFADFANGNDLRAEKWVGMLDEKDRRAIKDYVNRQEAEEVAASETGEQKLDVADVLDEAKQTMDIATPNTDTDLNTSDTSLDAMLDTINSSILDDSTNLDNQEELVGVIADLQQQIESLKKGSGIGIEGIDTMNNLSSYLHRSSKLSLLNKLAQQTTEEGALDLLHGLDGFGNVDVNDSAFSKLWSASRSMRRASFKNRLTRQLASDAPKLGMYDFHVNAATAIDDGTGDFEQTYYRYLEAKAAHAKQQQDAKQANGIELTAARGEMRYSNNEGWQHALDLLNAGDVHGYRMATAGMLTNSQLERAAAKQTKMEAMEREAAVDNAVQKEVLRNEVLNDAGLVGFSDEWSAMHGMLSDGKASDSEILAAGNKYRMQKALYKDRNKFGNTATFKAYEELMQSADANLMPSVLNGYKQWSTSANKAEASRDELRKSIADDTLELRGFEGYNVLRQQIEGASADELPQVAARYKEWHANATKQRAAETKAYQSGGYVYDSNGRIHSVTAGGYGKFTPPQHKDSVGWVEGPGYASFATERRDIDTTPLRNSVYNSDVRAHNVQAARNTSVTTPVQFPVKELAAFSSGLVGATSSLMNFGKTIVNSVNDSASLVSGSAGDLLKAIPGGGRFANLGHYWTRSFKEHNNALLGEFNSPLIAGKAVGGVASNLLRGNVLGAVTTGVNGVINYKTNQLQTRANNIASTIDLWTGYAHLIFDPLKLAADGLRMSFRFLTNQFLKGLGDMSRLGLPLQNLTGVNYAKYQYATTTDRLMRLSEGSTNNAMNALGYAGQGLYAIGQLNEKQLIGAAITGNFANVYSQDNNVGGRYADMVNNLYAQSKNAATDEERANLMFWANEIDSTLPNVIQQMTNLGISDYRKLTDGTYLTEERGMYFKPLGKDEKAAFDVTNFEWGAAQDQFKNSRMRITQVLWNKWGKTLVNAGNEVLDMIANNDWKGAIEKVKTTLSSVWDSFKEQTGFQGIDTKGIREAFGKIVAKIGDWLKPMLPTAARTFAELNTLIGHGWADMIRTFGKGMAGLITDLSQVRIHFNLANLIKAAKGDESITLGDVVQLKSMGVSMNTDWNAEAPTNNVYRQKLGNVYAYKVRNDNTYSEQQISAFNAAVRDNLASGKMSYVQALESASQAVFGNNNEYNYLSYQYGMIDKDGNYRNVTSDGASGMLEDMNRFAALADYNEGNKKFTKGSIETAFGTAYDDPEHSQFYLNVITPLAASIERLADTLSIGLNRQADKWDSQIKQQAEIDVNLNMYDNKGNKIGTASTNTSTGRTTTSGAVNDMTTYADIVYNSAMAGGF